MVPQVNPFAPKIRSGDTGGTIWAHLALILVSLGVAFPSPASVLWAGKNDGAPWLTLGAALLWGTLTGFLWLRVQYGRKSNQSTETSAATLLMIDVLGLTIMLSASGAAQNPFTILFFVPITQATLVARAWTFRIVALSVACFALLLAQTAETLRPHLASPHQVHFFDHVQGMAIALAIAGIFITVFVRRIAQALDTQEIAILDLSRKREQDRFTVALGALSAGAAHELGTPLASVQLLAEELPHMDAEARKLAAHTIVGEVQRMKTILHGMNSSELSAETLREGQPWPLTSLREDLPTDEITLKIVAPTPTTQPKKIVLQILRELIHNARQASENAEISVGLTSTASKLSLVVQDTGPGLSEEKLRRATEPFVSGTGSSGLGLFLATVHAKQLGGHLTLTSEVAQGTRAELLLPLDAPSALETTRSGTRSESN